MKEQSYGIVGDLEIDSEREDCHRQDFFVTGPNEQLNFLQHLTVLVPNSAAAVGRHERLPD